MTGMGFLAAGPILVCSICGTPNATPYNGVVVCGAADCLSHAMDCPCPPADNPDKPPLCQVQ